MKKIIFLVLSIALLTACDKTFVCNCAAESGGLPYKKVYLTAKTEGGAERRCNKEEENGEVCTLQ